MCADPAGVGFGCRRNLGPCPAASASEGTPRDTWAGPGSIGTGGRWLARLGWPGLAVRGRWVGVRDWLVGGSGGEFGVVGDLRLGLVGRGLCWKVLGVVGWSWSVMVGAFGLGVGGLGLVSGGLCFWVWGWWVGVGRSWFVLAGMALVGWGRSVVVCALRLVGWGWAGVVCA